MNGIGVVVARGGAPDALAPLGVMLDAMRARGPDARASWSEPGIAMGRTLARIAPEDRDDHQPLVDPSGRWVLVADARIHNRAELCDLLGANHLLGDAEMVLQAYLRWGSRAPERLVGDFAFAVWDRSARTLFCARDQVGIRPLYYTRIGGSAGALLVASELGAVLADQRVSRDPDDAALARYITRLYDESGRTLVRDVCSLPAGYSMTVSRETVALSCYYRPGRPVPLREKSDEEQAETFGPIFREAVRSRLRASAPIGVEVSGGLDSSAVACVASATLQSLHHGAPLRLFTLRFPGLDCDETPFSDAVASWTTSPLHSVLAEQRLETVSRALETHPVDAYYDPMIAVTGLLMNDAAQTGCRLMLTGAGGDELFWHTGVEPAAALREGRLREAWDVGLADDWRSPSSWSTIGRGLLRTSLSPRVRRAHRRARGVPRAWRRWLSPPAAKHAFETMLDVTEWLEGDGQDGVRSAASRSNNRPDAQLACVRVDRIAARRGAEYANPLCDRRLTEFCAALPYRQRSRRGLSKFVMRRALAGKVPPTILERRDKPGFLDFTTRVFTRHRDALRPIFAESELEKRGILRAGAALELLDHEQHVTMAVNVAAMELWLRDVRRT